MSEKTRNSVEGLSRRLVEQVRGRLESHLQGEVGLAGQLEESLWRSLPWHAALQEESPDRDLLFQAYAQSINGLATGQEECVSFLRAACRTGLEFRAETSAVDTQARDQVIHSEMTRLNQWIVLPPPAADRVFNAKLTSQPLEKITQVLTTELRQLTASVVRQFLELCVNLVEKEVVGLIEWANPGACELFYFKRALIQRQLSSVVEEGPARHETIAGGTKIVTSRTQRTAGEHEIRQARHEHHLHHATATPLDEVKSPIPQEFQPMLKAIPGWLRPAMRLVTGIQFRGTIQEVEVDKKSWQHARTLPSREEYRIHVDPVVILGPLVFAGWDDECQEIENQRLDHETKRQQSAEIQPLHASAVMYGLLLFILWQVLALAVVGAGEVYGSHLSWIGIVMAAAGLGMIVALVRFDALDGNGKPGVCTTAVLTAASGVAGCQLLGVALLRNSPGIGLTGVVFLFVSWILLDAFKKSRSV